MTHGGPSGTTVDLEGLASVLRGVLETKDASFDPWFYSYCGSLVDEAELETYVRHKTDLLEFAGIEPRGTTFLDAGAGFGITLVVLAQLGAAQATGLEAYGPMVDTGQKCIATLPDELRGRVALELGDVMAMPYDDSSFDAVISNEAISHYRDVEAALREIHRVLRPGGILAVSDGNNGLNPMIRRKTHDLWRAFEFGTDEPLVAGHAVTRNYQSEREAYIRDRHPELPADRLAQETFGMTFDEVDAACLEFARTGSSPGSRYDASEVPTDPTDGQVIERLFDPYALARMAERVGFRARVAGYWGGASGRPALRWANAALSRLSPLTMRTARGFRMAAVKPSSGEISGTGTDRV
jgi:ubiquinone/menaquinone biosynthesis C-methylase UbiE